MLARWRLCRLVGFVLGALAFGPVAGAEPQILIEGPGGSVTKTESPVGSQNWHLGLKKVTDPLNSSPTTITVQTDPGDVLASVTLKSQAPEQVMVVKLGQGTASRVGTVGSVAFGTEMSGPDIVDRRGFAEIELYSSGDVGSIEGTLVRFADIQGNLTGGVRARSLGFSAGRIQELNVGGSLTGIVEADATLSTPSNIDKIRAGSIGIAPDVPARIYATGLIGEIAAGQIANTTIQSTASPAPGDPERGYVFRVGVIDVGGAVPGPGTLSNFTLRARRVGGTLNPRIHVKGAFQSGLIAVGDIFSPVPGTNPPQNQRPEMKFEGGVQAGAMIAMNTFAPNNNGWWDTSDGKWTYPIKIGPDGPDQLALVETAAYTRTMVGGGVVGVVPFRMTGDEWGPIGIVDPWNVLFFLNYSGNLIMNPTAPPNATPLKIEFARVPFDGQFFDFSNCVAQSIQGISVQAEAAFLPPGTYLYKTTGESINEGPGGINGVWKSYILNHADGFLAGGAEPFPCAGPFGCMKVIEIVNPCPGDFSNDGLRDTADLTRLLSRFGNPFPCGTPEDMNVSFVVETADLTAFLSVFGIPCPAGRPGSGSPEAGATRAAETAAAPPQELGRPGSGDGGGATPVPPVLAALGFTTIEGYTAWVSGLTPTELSAHIVELIETIERLELP